MLPAQILPTDTVILVEREAPVRSRVDVQSERRARVVSRELDRRSHWNDRTSADEQRHTFIGCRGVDRPAATDVAASMEVVPASPRWQVDLAAAGLVFGY